MDPTLKEDVAWDQAETEVPPSDSPSRDRRHSSSASTSTLVTGDSNDPSSARGRRSRPSVASASSQLPTVREKKEQRALSFATPTSLTHTVSEEKVISSKKVASCH